MTVPELVDHCEATSTPVAHNRWSNGDPATQNGLQEGPDEVPPPPASVCTPDVNKHIDIIMHDAGASLGLCYCIFNARHMPFKHGAHPTLHQSESHGGLLACTMQCTKHISAQTQLEQQHMRS